MNTATIHRNAINGKRPEVAGEVLLPHVEEFLSDASQYTADETILLNSVRDEKCGVIDVVLVGREATIGFVFGRRADSRLIPAYMDAVYVVAALDVAHGLGDILYVAARNHPSLFHADARLRLVPHCSSRILGHRPRARSSYIGQGDDHQPIVIRMVSSGASEPRGPRRRHGVASNAASAESDAGVAA